eukprot:209295-Amphidinium_carterae.1
MTVLIDARQDGRVTSFVRTTGASRGCIELFSRNAQEESAQFGSLCVRSDVLTKGRVKACGVSAVCILMAHGFKCGQAGWGWRTIIYMLSWAVCRAETSTLLLQLLVQCQLGLSFGHVLSHSEELFRCQSSVSLTLHPLTVFQLEQSFQANLGGHRNCMWATPCNPTLPARQESIIVYVVDLLDMCVFILIATRGSVLIRFTFPKGFGHIQTRAPNRLLRCWVQNVPAAAFSCCHQHRTHGKNQLAIVLSIAEHHVAGHQLWRSVGLPLSSSMLGCRDTHNDEAFRSSI